MANQSIIRRRSRLTPASGADTGSFSWRAASVPRYADLVLDDGRADPPVAQRYRDYLTGEVLNERARWVPLQILLMPEGVLTFLSKGGRDLEQSIRVRFA